MSSDSADESSACRKLKVSSAMSFNWGLVDTKEVPFLGITDVLAVNIRLLDFKRYHFIWDEVCYPAPSTWGAKLLILVVRLGQVMNAISA